MITYEEFLANAEAEDIRILNLLSQGQEIKFTDGAEADTMFQRVVRLDTAGFIVEASRSYRRIDGVLWQTFSALIDPVASTYLARAASERILLSRLPLP